MRRGWGGGTRDRTAVVASWANDEAAAFGWVWPPSCFFLEGVEIIRIPTQRSVKALLCTDTRRIALRAIGSGIRVRGNASDRTRLVLHADWGPSALASLGCRGHEGRRASGLCQVMRASFFFSLP